MYNLVGQDGNAYSLMGYTAEAMRECNCSQGHIDEVMKNAKGGDYDNLIFVLDEEIQRLNYGEVS